MAKKDDKLDASQESELLNDIPTDTVDRLVEATATVDGKTYTFPIDKVDLFTSVKLSQYLMKENLRVGQKFSFNPTANAMLFIPELGANLNASNPIYEYKGDLTEEQEDKLLSTVRTGALLIGDLGVKNTAPILNSSAINCQLMLDKPFSVLKKDVMDILNKTTRVLDDGSIDSPYTELKALLNYEVSNKNRKDVVDLLRKAMNKIQGTVEFIDRMTDIQPIGKSNTKVGSTTGPAPKGNPMIAKAYL